MWERAELKDNAKTALKRFYWLAFVVCLLYGVFSSVCNIFVNMDTYLTTIRDIDGINFLQGLEGFAAGFSVFAMIISFLGAIFVLNPLSVGVFRFFMESRRFQSDISKIFYGFTGGRYMKIVKVMLIRDVKVILWSLLLVVPGIIKGYEYYFVPYLLAENADMPTSRYFEISKGMTNDEKMNVFVLELSFIGWQMLTLITCGMGMLFLNPYMHATYCECYALMRAKAFAYNLATPAELPDFYPPQPLQ